jgi:hydrogenase expression/formation protein HypE
MDCEMLGLGKLPLEFLQELLERYVGRDERLIVGPQIGEDAAVLDMGDRYLVVKSDPVTFATEEIGRYVVHVNANDIATMGASPRWLLLTLLLPEGATSRALVEAIMGQASQACQSLGITLCGGHTEVTYGLGRPIAVGLMLGEVDKDAIVRTAGARVGDDVILTKGIAIEGTAVLAREAGERLASRVSDSMLARARHLLEEPGISVVRDAQVVRQAGSPHAMHDPTEGGLATGLWELALASGTGVVVDPARVPLLPETQVLCQVLGLDPMGLIASGALLVTASPHAAGRMVQRLREVGIGASVIGRIVEGPPRVSVTTAAGLVPLRTFERDELARVFGKGE